MTIKSSHQYGIEVIYYVLNSRGRVCLVFSEKSLKSKLFDYAGMDNGGNVYIKQVAEIDGDIETFIPEIDVYPLGRIYFEISLREKNCET